MAKEVHRSDAELALERKNFKVPTNELVWITPDVRKKLFLDMLEEYKNRYPTMKLLYATLNYDSDLQADYIVVFDLELDGKHLIMIDMPFIYTTRSVPGYRYVKREDQMDIWFEQALSMMYRIYYEKFFELLADAKLSWKKEDPNYWKKADNFEAFHNELFERVMFFRANGG